MTRSPDAGRRERLEGFCRRLVAAPPASDHDEAMQQLSDILNRVEDEMTAIPYDPTFSLNDGRRYPPQSDCEKVVRGRTDVTRSRSERRFQEERDAWDRRS